MKPTLLYGIGAQKAGTTWLFSQLENHPGTYLTRPKELHYWNCVRAPFNREYALMAKSRLNAPGTSASLKHRLSPIWNKRARLIRDQAAAYMRVYDNGPFDHEAYLDYVGTTRPNLELVADITPAYTLLQRDTFHEMFSCYSQVKFLFIMRDPVDRLWSGVNERYRYGQARGPQAQDNILRAFTESYQADSHPDFMRSDYSRTIRALEAAVPKEAIHYCFFETLMDPELGTEVRESLADFLALEGLQLNVNKVVHPNHQRQSLPIENRNSARRALARIYDEIQQKFGSQVPKSWHIL